MLGCGILFKDLEDIKSAHAIILLDAMEIENQDEDMFEQLRLSDGRILYVEHENTYAGWVIGNIIEGDKREISLGAAIEIAGEKWRDYLIMRTEWLAGKLEQNAFYFEPLQLQISRSKVS